MQSIDFKLFILKLPLILHTCHVHFKINLSLIKSTRKSHSTIKSTFPFRRKSSMELWHLHIMTCPKYPIYSLCICNSGYFRSNPVSSLAASMKPVEPSHYSHTMMTLLKAIMKTHVINKVRVERPPYLCIYIPLKCGLTL
jgi:hypothetical protein